MGKKELIVNGHFEKGTRNNLKEHYSHIYKCDKCKKVYGSDKKESKYLCPICTENGKNKKM